MNGITLMRHEEGFTHSSENLQMSQVDDTIPDGGLIAWIQCAGSFSLMLNSFGIVNSFGL